MGASLSNLSENGSGGPGLGDIPESCVACVFLYLTPPEICNLARLNRAFRGAASSDAVWEAKLPSNYHDLLNILSNPDVGLQVVWLDKFTGRVCMSISAKAMGITGIEDRRYWNWFPTEESRFHVVAYLQQIWWFEVDGSVKFPFPPDIYTLSFRIHLGRFSKRLGRRVCNFEHAHGWDIKPVRFEFSTSDGQQASSECFLDDTTQDDSNGSYKRGCWLDCKVGEFIVTDSDPETEVRFSMKQIDCTHSKGGLCVDSVSIIPRSMDWNGNHLRGVPFVSRPENSFGYLYNYNYDQFSGLDMKQELHTMLPTTTLMDQKNVDISTGQDPKKKRLSTEQLESLENSFQEEIKLEPDRKLKLAKELGLQPRQIAVWFQNRRARWKAKQLERVYDALKQDFDAVSREKNKLQQEVFALRAILKEQVGKKQVSTGYITDQVSGTETVESTSIPSSEKPPLGTHQFGVQDNYNDQIMMPPAYWPVLP
ncbi:hypothetical protein RD792_014205 [Penstemon davidsonii]|uniref:Uncharacterized protein n=1 Tax=Penstemon davidsonii TaxID=160366 RepID=A0ABR0CNM8_9LAMI|nr:hypothetical protein RD792_014205 [Penstemon davidsonii]